MRQVWFVDTSVLCNALAVPGKSQDREAVGAQLRDVTQRGDVDLVIPVAAVIETGNHVAQVGDGWHRRQCAERFEKLLRRVVDGQLPWTLHAVPWDGELLRTLCDGPGSTPDLTTMAEGGVGAGDLSILAECALYASKVPTAHVTVWTFDRGLAAHVPAPL